MQIDKFWVVTKATKTSELEDVMFETDLAGMALQFRGGLDPRDILGVFTNDIDGEQYAHQWALRSLKNPQPKTYLVDINGKPTRVTIPET